MEEEILPFPEENRHDIIDFLIENENGSGLVFDALKKLRNDDN
jgi:hypothetical protein